MAVSLADYVESLKREVQPPGSNLFAAATDADWVGHLADAFWEARLDGLLEGYVVEYDSGDDDGDISPVDPQDIDLDGRGMAVVILYAGIKVLRNRILNMATGGFRAKAGPVEYEQNQAAATVLAEMLKQLRATKDKLLEAIDDDEETAVMVIDTFSSRLYGLDNGGYYATPELSG